MTCACQSILAEPYVMLIAISPVMENAHIHGERISMPWLSYEIKLSGV